MQYAKTPRQNINGFLLLDKPLGISANGALQAVKRLLNANKAGHTGSLDPLASGMLPICLGEATKFSQFLLEADKCYWVVAQLGAQTTTGDKEGEIVKQCEVPEISDSELEKVLTKFRGVIKQVPSMFSALKHQGKPLYELARKGITVERPAREVNIYELKLLARTKDTLTLEVSCSKGTYIRNLVEDIGEALGYGAHVAELRRLTVAGFQENKMITLDALQNLADKDDQFSLQKYILPIDAGLQHWPAIILSEAALYYIRRGQSIISPQAPASGWVRLHDQQGHFIGAAEILDDGRVAPKRLVAL